MKIAVIGSNRGIGLELVRQLVRAGHQVFAFCRQSSPALRECAPAAIIEHFEVTDAAQMQRSVAALDLTRLDWLFHVSGMLTPQSLSNFDPAAIVKQFTVNAIAPVLTVQVFTPHMTASSKIGLLTSRMGSMTDNTTGGSYGYRMSKAALNAAGKSLSLDLKSRGIAVFLLHPGYVKTDMTHQRGLIDTAESSRGLIALMEQKTAQQTGTFWHVNGEQLPW
jgi:NAD(P)-dependent dehydrogenase (short-subunit alcohol dehydrogenase family)